jgi:transcriptional regulator with XRE-family HTH domain
MMKAGRILAGLSQKDLAKASGIRTQTISRMETAGAEAIVSRDSSVVPVLAALGRAGVMMQQRGVALAQESKSPAQENAGPADASQLHPPTAHQVYLR